MKHGLKHLVNFENCRILNFESIVNQPLGGVVNSGFPLEKQSQIVAQRSKLYSFNFNFLKKPKNKEEELFFKGKFFQNQKSVEWRSYYVKLLDCNIAFRPCEATTGFSIKNYQYKNFLMHKENMEFYSMFSKLKVYSNFSPNNLNLFMEQIGVTSPFFHASLDDQLTPSIQDFTQIRKNASLKNIIGDLNTKKKESSIKKPSLITSPTFVKPITRLSTVHQLVDEKLIIPSTNKVGDLVRDVSLEDERSLQVVSNQRFKRRGDSPSSWGVKKPFIKSVESLDSMHKNKVSITKSTFGLRQLNSDIQYPYKEMKYIDGVHRFATEYSRSADSVNELRSKIVNKEISNFYQQVDKKEDSVNLSRKLSTIFNEKKLINVNNQINGDNHLAFLSNRLNNLKNEKNTLQRKYNKFHTLPIFSTFVYKEWSHRFSFLEYFIWSARKNDLVVPFYTRRNASHTARISSMNLIRNQLGLAKMPKQFLFRFNGYTKKTPWNDKIQKLVPFIKFYKQVDDQIDHSMESMESSHFLQLRHKGVFLAFSKEPNNLIESFSYIKANGSINDINFINNQVDKVDYQSNKKYKLTLSPFKQKSSAVFRQMEKLFRWRSSLFSEDRVLTTKLIKKSSGFYGSTDLKYPEKSLDLATAKEKLHLMNENLSTFNLVTPNNMDQNEKKATKISLTSGNFCQLESSNKNPIESARLPESSLMQGFINTINSINEVDTVDSVYNQVDDTQQFPRLGELLRFTGGTALRHLLSRFNLVLLSKFIRHELKNLELKVNFLLALKMLTYSQGLLLGKLAKRRSKQIRRLKLLELFQSKKSNPEWMILSVLPVLPPDLRPILRVNDDFVVASDLNRLYQTVLRRNNTIHERLDDPLPCPESGLFRQRSLQKAVDGLLENGKGGGTPLCASKRRPLVSLSHVLKGKKGLFRQHLLGKRVDYSGRSVIVVGPKLNLHECGLPKEMALELFQPFLIHRLKVKGLATSNTIARRMIQQEDPIIWHTVKQLVYEHPVLLNRAPTLHRLGIQAFQPRLVSGRAILLHPLVCNGFNADFDGDQMAVHVPLSFQARAEAWKIMWSKNNLLSPATGQPILVPSQDMVLGCYYLSVMVPRALRFSKFDNKVDQNNASFLSFNDIVINESDEQNLLTDRQSRSKMSIKSDFKKNDNESDFINKVDNQPAVCHSVFDTSVNIFTPPNLFLGGGGHKDKDNKDSTKSKGMINYVDHSLQKKERQFEWSGQHQIQTKNFSGYLKNTETKNFYEYFNEQIHLSAQFSTIKNCILSHPPGYFKKNQHFGFLTDANFLEKMATIGNYPKTPDAKSGTSFSPTSFISWKFSKFIGSGLSTLLIKSHFDNVCYWPFGTGHFQKIANRKKPQKQLFNFVKQAKTEFLQNKISQKSQQISICAHHLKRGHYFGSLQESLMAYSQGRLQTHTPFWVRLDYNIADGKKETSILHDNYSSAFLKGTVVSSSRKRISQTSEMKKSSSVVLNYSLLQPQYGRSQALSTILFQEDRHRFTIEGNETLEAPLELRVGADGNLVKIVTTFQNHYSCNATILDQCKEKSIRYMRTTVGRVIINNKVFDVVNRNF